MADFLKSLAARSLGMSRLVRPQIGPRFGPEPRLGAEQPIWDLEERPVAIAERSVDEEPPRKDEHGS